MTDLDTFEADLREMLARRAKDVGDEANVVILHPHSGPRRLRRRSIAGAAAVIVALAGLTIGLWPGGGDSVDTGVAAAGSGPGPANATVVQHAEPQVVPWGTSTPSEDQLPAGYQLGSGQAIYRGDRASTPGVVVDAYFRSRFRGAPPPGLGASEVERTDRFALYRWEWTSSPGGEGDGGKPEGLGGWIYLREGDGAWEITAATTDGVDLVSLVSDGQGLHGRVTSTDESAFSLEAVVSDGSGQELQGSGELYASEQAVGVLDVAADVGPNQVQVRVQHVGGTWLSITELVMPQNILDTDLVVIVDPATDDGRAVAEQLATDERVIEWRRLEAPEARAMYATVLFRGPRFAEVWDDQASLVVYLVSLQNGTVLEDVTLAYESSVGVLVAAPLAPAQREQPIDGPESEVPDEARPGFEPVGLVVATESVSAPPVPVICLGVLGVQVPPNEITVVAQPVAADTPAEALAAFFEGPGQLPVFRKGLVELVGPDGAVSYGYRGEAGGLLMVIRLRDQSNGSFAVFEWEATAC